MKHMRVHLAGCSLWLALALATGLSWAGDEQAGQVFETSQRTPPRLVIEGTSNVKDWTAEGAAINGRIVFPTALGDTADWQAHVLAQTPRITVSIPVASLEGSGGRGMDRVMRSTLDADNHPDIVFALTLLQRAETGPDEDETDAATPPESLAVEAQGELTVAGQTRTVIVRGTLATTEDGLTIEGQADLRMTDFGLEPPRALLGAIRAGDEITVHLAWALEPATP